MVDRFEFNSKYIFLWCSFLIGLPFLFPSVQPLTGQEEYRVSAPPKSVVDTFNLDSFYRKYLDVRGFPVISSEEVSDYALKEAAYLIRRMLHDRSDLIDAMVKHRIRFVVMAHNEYTTDIPEYETLSPADHWDRRARGLGATRSRPAVSCGEENLLEYPGDPYASENILIHEFAHTVHQFGVNTVRPSFQSKLKTTYKQAMKQGLWEGTYAAKNVSEYWAEGVQSWFNTNREDDPQHNHVDTRAELREYDPNLARLIDSVFRTGNWTYTPPSGRQEKKHLKGYDPDAAPTFKWSVR